MEAVPVTSSFISSSVAIPLVGIVLALVALHFWMESWRMVRLGKKIPGPPPLPLIGNAHLAIGVKPEHIVEKLLEIDIYGNVVRAFLGPKLIVFLSDPRDVELILSSNVHLYKSFEYTFFKPWLGDGLLITSGNKWKTHRKIIAPTFHQSILKTFVPLFYENSIELISRLKSEVGKEFDCHDYLSATTVDILRETAMGCKTTTKDKTGHDYAMAVMKLCNILHRRQYNFFLRPDPIYKLSNMFKEQKKLLNVIHTLTGNVIKLRQTEYKEKGDKMFSEKNVYNKAENEMNNQEKAAKLRYVRDDLDDLDDNDVGEKRRLAFLDTLLSLYRGGGGNFTEEEVIEEVNTIMFEGHDTTAAGSSFFMCVMGCHPDIQQRCVEELDGIFKGSDRPCTFQDTLEMKYLERVILETLRMFPPVPVIAREIKEDVQLASGDYLVPKGTTVVIPQFKIHRLEELYPNPEVFDPDNFLPEKMQNRHYYAFIPFSAGPRSCVGRKFAMLKLKVLLSTILRNYKITSAIQDKDFKLQVDIILKRSDGFMVKVEPRNPVKVM